MLEDGPRLVAGYANGAVVVFDKETAQVLLVAEECGAGVVALALLPEPMTFNNIAAITLQRPGERRVDPVCLRKYPAEHDAVLRETTLPAAPAPPRAEALDAIYLHTSPGGRAVSDADATAGLREELERWKKANAKLLRCLDGID